MRWKVLLRLLWISPLMTLKMFTLILCCSPQVRSNPIEKVFTQFQHWASNHRHLTIGSRSLTLTSNSSYIFLNTLLLAGQLDFVGKIDDNLAKFGNGLVVTSGIIKSVGQNCRLTSFLAMRLMMREYLKVKCQVLLPELALPFVSYFMERWLSRNTTFSVTS